MSEIKDKLRLLGLKLSPQEKPKTKISRFRLDNDLVGKYIDTHSGSIFVRETVLPVDYSHGWLSPIRYPSEMKLLAQYARLHDHTSIEPNQVVYLDTETTGLAGGTGTYAFMVGVGRFTPNGFFLRQYIMADPTEEVFLIEALQNEFDTAQTTVSYNGKAFDIPLLESRFILNGFPMPFEEMQHLDLLHPARRLWRNRFDSCRLSALEYYVLGIVRSEDDIPGSMIPQMYFDFLQSRDPEFFNGILYHNQEDIVSLAAFHQLIAQILENPDQCDEKILDFFELGKLYEDLHENDRARDMFRRIIEPDSDVNKRHSFLLKRIGDWPEAVEIWLRECDAGCDYAMLELAKYYEHQRRDFEKARHFSTLLTRAIMDSGKTCSNEDLDAIEKRLQRLDRKIRAAEADKISD